MTKTYRKLAAFAFSGVLLSSLTSQTLALGTSSISINHDRGGRVIEYALKVKKAEKYGKMVRFRGKCDSACTLYLSLPKDQICIEPGAHFGFHKAYGASRKANRSATDYLVRKYPSWVRSWIRSKGGLSTSLKVMNYQYASKFIKPCKKGGNIRIAALSSGPLVHAASAKPASLKKPQKSAFKGIRGYSKPVISNDSSSRSWRHGAGGR